MSSCLDQTKCLRKTAHLPGIFEATLHCMYTGFFIIEAATYGLILEQKFHGVLQILLINFYLVLLCLVFIRWNLDLDSAVCHLLISLLSFVLTLFVGKLILMYIDYMERPRQAITKLVAFDGGSPVDDSIQYKNSSKSNENDDLAESFPKKVSLNSVMKLDPFIIILDISVYLLISISYIVMQLKISLKLRNNSKMRENTDANMNNTDLSHVQSFYEIGSLESSILSSNSNLA